VIISQLIGGLGNQMFQYAAGRALAVKRHTPLKLDISGFRNYQLYHGFELTSAFELQCDIAADADVQRMLGFRANRLARAVLQRFPGLHLGDKRFIREPHIHYWEEFNEAPVDCYLSGYWQSERYFTPIAEVIRGDFSFSPATDTANIACIRKIAEVPSVSLHVRRGDYVSNPEAARVHGTCNIEYYAKAIAYVAARERDIHLFIFSDDPDWAVDNLPLGSWPYTCVSHNTGKDSWRDMHLMSLCRHNITANSSFSWWGAWLNRHPGKMVVAPSRWFASRHDASDVVPVQWVCL
jgi:hypothetical protein